MEIRSKRRMPISIVLILVLVLQIFSGGLWSLSETVYAQEQDQLTLTTSEEQIELGTLVEFELADLLIDNLVTDDLTNEPTSAKLYLTLDEGLEFVADVLEERDYDIEQMSEREYRIVWESPDASEKHAVLPIVARTTGQHTLVVEKKYSAQTSATTQIDFDVTEPEVDVSESQDSISPRATIQNGEEDISGYDASQVMNIASDADFQAAFTNPKIVVFNVIKDFAITESTATQNNFNITGTMNPTRMRKVIIEGNGHTVDFRGRLYLPNSSSGSWDIMMQNLISYSRNYYGPISTVNVGSSYREDTIQRFHNFKTIGSQMLAAYNTTVRLSGEVENELLADYISPIDKKSYSTAYTGQQNLEVSNLNILEDAVVTLKGGSSGNIDLRNNGNFVVEKNAVLNIDNTKSSNNAGETPPAIYIRQGNFTLKEGSEVNIKQGPTRQYGIIRMDYTGNEFKIGKHAKLDIQVTGQTVNDNANYNLIYLGAGTKLIVESEGTLNISSTKTGAGRASLIYANNDAVFTVGKKGIFNIVSDGTGQKDLIRLGSSAVFRFSDAEKVNMQFNNSNVNANSSLVYMYSGNFDVDVQSVKGWKRGSDVTAVDKPDFDWSPMFGMNIPYVGNAITRQNLRARSVNSATLNEFYRNFDTGTADRNSTLPPSMGGGSIKTSGFQRLTFGYIPDVEVGILSTATDLVTDDSSRVVKGVTNPGAYVRISDTTYNNKKAPAIDPAITDKEPSPVELMPGETPDETTKNFTVKADEQTGEFSLTLPAGKHFEAKSIIKVYSFKDGKSDTKTQEVLDKTKPAGDGVDYHEVRGNAAPNPKVFVTNPRDTNPAPQNFTYRYAAETPLADVEKMMDKVGKHVVKVDLLDEAQNVTTITGSLEIHETLSELTANDIEIAMKDLKGMSAAQIDDYILKESEAKAFKVVDGKQTLLTRFIQVADRSGLVATSPVGDYTIKLRVRKADSGLAQDLEKTINFKVNPSIGKIIVTFKNEVAKDVHAPITIEDEIGKVVDLETHPEVKAALAQINLDNYQLKTSPTNKKIEIKVADTPAAYTFVGTLKIQSYPSSIDFGSKEVSYKGMYVDEATIDAPLIIWDNRADLESWTLTATLEVPLTNKDDDTKIIHDAIRYKNNKKEIILGDEAEPIEIRTHSTAGKVNISEDWGAGKEGFKLDVPAGAVNKLGDYQGTILWQLGDTK